MSGKGGKALITPILIILLLMVMITVLPTYNVWIELILFFTLFVSLFAYALSRF